MTNLQSNLSQLQAAVVKAAETIYQTHTIDADALDKINQLGLSLIDPLNAEPTDLNDPTPLTVRICTGIQMVHVKTNESPFVKLMELLDLNGLIAEFLQKPHNLGNDSDIKTIKSVLEELRTYRSVDEDARTMTTNGLYPDEINLAAKLNITLEDLPITEEKVMTLEEAKQLMINRYAVSPDLDDDDYELLAEEYDIELEI